MNQLRHGVEEIKADAIIADAAASGGATLEALKSSASSAKTCLRSSDRI